MTRQLLPRGLLWGVLGLAMAFGAGARAPAPAAAPALAPALAPAYTIRLTSAWPAYAGEAESCNNRASEALAGTLTRVDGVRYAGRLARSSAFEFCGAHGQAQPRSCGLRLAGSGDVDVEAAAFDAGSGPELRLRWTPVLAETSVRVDGTCSRDFQEAVKAMYLRVVHLVEIPVSPDVLGGGAVPVPDYGWVVEVD